MLGDLVKITFMPNYAGFSWWVSALPTWVNVLYAGLLIVLVVAAYPAYLFYTQTRRDSVWASLAFVFLVAACLGHLLGDIGQPYTTDFIHRSIRVDEHKPNLVDLMKAKIDTLQGKQIYAKRLAIVEPVFANIRVQKRLDHFTLRTKSKINVQ